MADLGKRYSRNLMGINAQGFVELGDDGLIAAGIGYNQLVHDTAYLIGQVGIMADGLTNVDALVAGEKFKIVQKITEAGNISVTGELATSIELVWGDDVVVTKVAYDAPVLQEDSAAIASADIDALLAIGGLKEFVAAARDTTPANQPFPVEEGRAVIRNVTTSAYDMLKNLVTQINGDKDYERNADDLFAVATVSNAAVAGAVSVAASAFLAQGSNQVFFNVAPTGPTVGEYISFVPTGATAEDLYKITAISGTAVTLDRAWAHPNNAIAVANMKVGAAVSGAWALGFVGTTTDTHFSSITSEDLGDFPMTTVQAWKQGSGDAPSVAAMEEEFSVFEGATTINAQWEADYGKPTRFSDAAETYDMFIIKYKKTTASMAFPNEQAHHLGYVIIAAEAGSDLSTKLATTFGV